jgi:hypothetical protein
MRIIHLTEGCIALQLLPLRKVLATLKKVSSFFRIIIFALLISFLARGARLLGFLNIVGGSSDLLEDDLQHRKALL